MSARRTLAVALCAAVGCVEDGPPGVEIDLGGVCHALELVEVTAPLVDGEEVLALAADSRETAWALVRPSDGGDLVLRRAPDPGPALDLAIDPTEGAATALFAGAAAGETWLTYAGPSRFRVAQIGAEGIVRVGDLDAFPGDGAWERRIVLAGRRPLALALPTSSPSSEVRLYLGVLAPDLSIERTWELTFGSDCYTDGVSECVATTYPRLHILDVAEPMEGAPSLLLLEFQREFEGVLTRTTGVATLELDVDPRSGTPIALKREYIDLLWAHSTTDLRVAPGQIARDSAGYYVIAGANAEESGDLADDRLLRHDLRESTSGLIARLPKYTASHLIQLDDQVALGQAFMGTWLAARLVGYSLDLAEIAELPIAGDVTVSRAGRHHALLRSAAGPDVHAAVRCASDDP